MQYSGNLQLLMPEKSDNISDRHISINSDILDKKISEIDDRIEKIEIGAHLGNTNVVGYFHYLEKYPFVFAMQVTDGAGFGGAGLTPAGGDNISKTINWKYDSLNKISIFISAIYKNPKVTKKSENSFTVTFDNSGVSYEIFLV